MQEILNYLRECQTFYIATMDGDQPRVRPFGAVAEFEGRLYFVTNNQKNVFKQMSANSKIEISGMNKGTWIRLEAKAIADSRREAREKMLADNPSLSRMYSADDGVMDVLYLQDATATISSFTEAPRVIEF